MIPPHKKNNKKNKLKLAELELIRQKNKEQKQTSIHTSIQKFQDHMPPCILKAIFSHPYSIHAFSRKSHPPVIPDHSRTIRRVAPFNAGACEELEDTETDSNPGPNNPLLRRFCKGQNPKINICFSILHPSTHTQKD
jgi:hypothetical protein